MTIAHYICYNSIIYDMYTYIYIYIFATIPYSMIYDTHYITYMIYYDIIYVCAIIPFLQYDILLLLIITNYY